MGSVIGFWNSLGMFQNVSFVIFFHSPSFHVLICIKALPQKYLLHFYKSIYISIPLSFSAKSFLVWILFMWLFLNCLHDKWTWTSPSFCMVSHGVFLQSMISVLHSLLSSLFLPQDIRQYSYHHIHWTLLLFAMLLSFSRLSSLNFFKDLLSSQISWTCSLWFLPQLLCSCFHPQFMCSFLLLSCLLLFHLDKYPKRDL